MLIPENNILPLRGKNLSDDVGSRKSRKLSGSCVKANLRIEECKNAEDAAQETVRL